MSAYTIFLYLHSWLRWAVLLLALIVLFRAFRGWLGQKSFTKADNQSSVFFTASMHLQLLIGLILYFVFSPLGLAAFQDGMGAVMKNGGVRYYAVEHIFTMVLAVVLVQIGRTRAKKAKTDLLKHRNLAIFTLVGLLLVLIRIPWAESARLFRGLY